MAVFKCFISLIQSKFFYFDTTFSKCNMFSINEISSKNEMPDSLLLYVSEFFYLV